MDSTFLRHENNLLKMKVQCVACGSEIKLFINPIASAGEVCPFCEKCGSYADVKPGDQA